jgi:tight adherence protein B
MAMGMLMLSLAVVLWLESAYFQKSWFRRAAEQAELEGLEKRSPLRRFLSKLPDPLDWLWMPLWRTGIGQEMRATWIAAGMPWKPSRYPSSSLVLAAVAYLVGIRIAGPLLGAALAGASVWGLGAIVKSRAERRYREVDEQLPAAIDAIAAGIASGQSFQLALHATADEQQGALGLVLKVVSTRLKLGMPVEEALLQLLEEQTQEGLALVVEGIILQRQFGGDLVKMLDDAAALLRDRHELEREVRAITAQGRLSGAIVAGLVPVSAGFLLLFNPGYLDILFNTLIGQVLVVLTIAFQLAGWYVISRLVRVRY